MNKVIKKFRVNGFVTFLIIVVSLIGCSSDIVLEPLESLLGIYEGRYRVTINIGNNPRTTEYLISWKFSDNNYWMYDIDPDENFCVPSGSYTLSGGVTLDEKFTGEIVVCDTTFNPRGVFSLRQPEDSVILSQQIGDIFKELLLEKVSD